MCVGRAGGSWVSSPAHAMKLGAVNNAVSRSWAQYKHSPREQQGVARDVVEGCRGERRGGGTLAVGSKVIAAGRWLLEFILMHRPQLPQQRRNASGSGRRAARERSRREADEQQQEEGNSSQREWEQPADRSAVHVAKRFMRCQIGID